MAETTPSEEEQERLRNMVRERPPPEVIEQPGPGQESVWDYPRPPVIERVPEKLKVLIGGEVIAATEAGLRVIETAGAPVYYFPPSDVNRAALVPTSQTSFCEWKGAAQYWNIQFEGRHAEYAAWSYAEPRQGFGSIAGYFAFYPAKVDACCVGEEQAQPQPGGFYGGWVTDKICGPIKGIPGSAGW